MAPFWQVSSMGDNLSPVTMNFIKNNGFFFLYEFNEAQNHNKNIYKMSVKCAESQN